MRLYTHTMEQITDLLIQLPDGTYAVLHRGMTWGEAVIIILLTALVLLRIYEVWSSR